MGWRPESTTSREAAAAKLVSCPGPRATTAPRERAEHGIRTRLARGRLDPDDARAHASPRDKRRDQRESARRPRRGRRSTAASRPSWSCASSNGAARACRNAGIGVKSEAPRRVGPHEHAAALHVHRADGEAEQHHTEDEPWSALSDSLFGDAARVECRGRQVAEHDGCAAPERDERESDGSRNHYPLPVLDG